MCQEYKVVRICIEEAGGSAGGGGVLWTEGPSAMAVCPMHAHLVGPTPSME